MNNYVHIDNHHHLTAECLMESRFSVSEVLYEVSQHMLYRLKPVVTKNDKGKVVHIECPATFRDDQIINAVKYIRKAMLIMRNV